MKGYKIEKLGELERFLKDEAQNKGKGAKCTCVEVIVGREDAAEPLKRTFKKVRE